MKRRVFYILIISICSVSVAKAQTLSQVVDFADQQYHMGNFEIAAKEYNRVLFFGNTKKDYLAMQVGNCYQELNEYSMASVFYDKAYAYSSVDSIKNRAILNKAFCLLMGNEYILALSELYNFEDVPDVSQNIEYHFLNGIANYGLENDSTAYAELTAAIRVFGNSQPEKLAELEEEFNRVYGLQKRYSPKRAYYLSALPGLGQFQSGAIKDGINSITLISFLFYVSARIAISYSYLDALLTIVPWMQRYYMGGMEKAQSIAQEKIKEERYESYLKILELTSPEFYK